MTIEEIFSRLSAHSIRGMMIHEQMANYYDFLGLHGFKRCHDYHYLDETLQHRKIQKFYINRYSKLVPDSKVDSSSVIPEAWYKTTRQAVDKITKRNAVESGFREWIDWERETGTILAEMCIEAEQQGDIVAGEFLRDLIRDNAKELKKAERMHIKLESTDYDMTFIAEIQNELHEKYKAKIKEVI